MGRYLGKCKGVVGEIAVVGVRTRARAARAMAAATEKPANTATSPRKKIKKVSKSYHIHYQLRNRRRNSSESENFVEKGVTTSFSEVVEEKEEVKNCEDSEVITTCKSDFPPSCSSSNYDQSSFGDVVKDRLGVRIADPEVESHAEASSRYIDCERTEEASEASKSENQDSPATILQDAKSTVEIKMPSDSEIEEFFTSAEKDLQKRFIDKYNFDIVNDVPLDGRYVWFQ